MRLLELFSGFGHVSGHFREHGWETLTLDYAKHLNADICIDILQWDYTVYPRDYFDAVWASPDCTSWSIVTDKHRTLLEGLIPKTKTAVLGEKLIHRTLEIIKYFQPYFYIIENPRGRLRYFPPMKHTPFRTTVYYANYGFTYSKPTDLWSNVPLWEEQSKTGTELWGVVKKFNNTNMTRATQRSIIPKPLIEKLFGVVNSYVRTCL